jgi:hypothetical protein
MTLSETSKAWLRASTEASGVPYLIADENLPRLWDLLYGPEPLDDYQI